MEGRTAIVIAHRLSTIQKMDRIIVLEQGTISEQGSHVQLLKNNGTYAKLWAHQSGGFMED
jgi:ABC-type multidrug transport system fused ATPase/permease subunit